MDEPTKYPKLPILLVDDEEQTLRAYSISLAVGGMNNIISCNDSRDVENILAKQEVELILLDLTMPHISGEKILSSITRNLPDIPVIIATAATELTTAVSCMREGAHDYIVKPVTKERLLSVVKRAIEMRCLRRENSRLKKHVLSKELDNPEAFEEFDSTSEKMLSLFRYAESIAPSREPVLLTGETGVGKELMARAIHKLSNPNGEFVPVNVAGLDDSAFSDTLFGHKKGAFTGAEEERKGLIEKVGKGTLFFDEIGDLRMESQIKLLRLLQEHEYFPLGSDVMKRSQARFVVATNRNIDDLKESSDFRDDLYYRLCHHQINIPPLREHISDLPILINKFIEKAALRLNKKKPIPPKELVTLLSSHPFPGNIRELAAMINDAVSSHKSGKLSLDLFRKRTESKNKGRSPAPPSSAQFPETLPTLSESQDALVEEALKRAKGNQSIAADILGITRQALNKRLTRKKKAADSQTP